MAISASNSASSLPSSASSASSCFLSSFFLRSARRRYLTAKRRHREERSPVAATSCGPATSDGGAHRIVGGRVVGPLGRMMSRSLPPPASRASPPLSSSTVQRCGGGLQRGLWRSTAAHASAWHAVVTLDVAGQLPRVARWPFSQFRRHSGGEGGGGVCVRVCGGGGGGRGEREGRGCGRWITTIVCVHETPMHAPNWCSRTPGSQTPGVPRHPEPSTKKNSSSSRAEKWELTSMRTECEKCCKMRQKPVSAKHLGARRQDPNPPSSGKGGKFFQKRP